MFRKIIDFTTEANTTKANTTKAKLQDIADILTYIMPTVRKELEKMPSDIKNDLTVKHPVAKLRLSVTLEYDRSKIKLADKIK